MNASELRWTIAFQSPTTASDGMGGKTASEWVTDRTTRAKVMPIGSNINYENGQNRGVISYEITCRYLPDYEISHETRILYDGKYLTPNVTVNVDQKRVWMSFEANEKVEY